MGYPHTNVHIWIFLVKQMHVSSITSKQDHQATGSLHPEPRETFSILLLNMNGDQEAPDIQRKPEARTNREERRRR